MDISLKEKIQLVVRIWFPLLPKLFAVGSKTYPVVDILKSLRLWAWSCVIDFALLSKQIKTKIFWKVLGISSFQLFHPHWTVLQFGFKSVSNMHKNNRSITKKESITDGKKPRMQCEICEAYFSAKSSLNLHIASVHNRNSTIVNCVTLNSLERVA